MAQTLLSDSLRGCRARDVGLRVVSRSRRADGVYGPRLQARQVEDNRHRRRGAAQCSPYHLHAPVDGLAISCAVQVITSGCKWYVTRNIHSGSQRMNARCLITSVANMSVAQGAAAEAAHHHAIRLRLLTPSTGHMRVFHRTRGEERRQADGVHGAAVQQGQQRAGNALLSRIRARRQQHPARRVRRHDGPRVATVPIPVPVFVPDCLRCERRCGLCATILAG